MAFATGDRPPDTGSLYPRRWGTGIGHRVARQTRIRLPGRDERSRIFCLVLQLLAHNAWTMTHSDGIVGGDGRRIPQAEFRTLLALEAYRKLGIRPLRKLPPSP